MTRLSAMRYLSFLFLLVLLSAGCTSNDRSADFPAEEQFSSTEPTRAVVDIEATFPAPESEATDAGAAACAAWGPGIKWTKRIGLYYGCVSSLVLRGLSVPVSGVCGSVKLNRPIMLMWLLPVAAKRARWRSLTVSVWLMWCSAWAV